MIDFDLFDFQQEDVDKLKTKRSRLIGNDPGTGKTYEGIALDLLNRTGDGNSKVDLSELFPDGIMKTLVLAPKSVLGVWDQHLMELTNEDIYLYSYQTRQTFLKQALDPRRGGYFIMNWDSVRVKDMQALQKVNWFHIIGDEIHRAKNRKAQLTQAFWKLKTIYKTGMSGTPADNKPTDLWGILHWLWPNYYTSYWRFVKAYTTMEWSPDGYSKITGLDEVALVQLHEEMAPWFVRRRKQDVLTDLPDKYYSRIWVDLGTKQRRAYDQMRKTMVAWAEQYHEELERQDPIIAQAAVSQLVRLQQYANGYLIPRLDQEGEQVVRIRKKTNKETGEVELIEVPQFDVVDPSAKLDMLMDFLEDRSEEQIVIFSQFKSVINLLATRLENAKIPYGLLTGDITGEDRTKNVEAFQAGRLRIFAGTIAAGGVGITLTASSTVVFLDRSWSPAINIQAEDRTHRIGQTEAVEVIDIMARNTVDLGKAQQVAMKWKWLQMLLGDEVDTEQVIQNIDMTKLLDITEEEL